ncbi:MULTISPECIES: hypothetical protein [unclassified Breznakia]|uniref:hypothetical protein n=1 Tax=unclassified Breznakia TaxID=2623764 RepID=UPI002475E457|nr:MULTISPECIES: hypothetical protein [unclassified Breznakia]MDH6367445.1 hypothetical protein [Breznakia sp. PH1-1]MDH6404582.1 hypothetical protein [Breznakia sp. PF1-11]MDH6412291.1 hypothetical protein [Breznakia sp. PFB1-11]MDH6414612.1 hypothetical protein [Breznakia sp. PFB1-14]MDH6416983.1 hypothetical protein [Breznakia sp. PFB1-4]
MKNKQQKYSLIAFILAVISIVSLSVYDMKEKIKTINRIVLITNLQDYYVSYEKISRNRSFEIAFEQLEALQVELEKEEAVQQQEALSEASDGLTETDTDEIQVVNPSGPIVPKRLYSTMKSDSKGHMYREYFDTTSQTTSIMMGGEEMHNGQATYLPRNLIDRGDDCFYVENSNGKEFNIYLGEHAYYLYDVNYDVSYILDDVNNNNGQNAITIYK